MSFRNHVSGAGTGVKMSDYNINDWGSWTGLPDPEVVSFASGHTFTFGFTISEGSYAPYIRRTGTSIVSVTSGGDTGFGQSVTASSSVTSSSTGSASVTIVSRVNPDAALEPINVASAWFTGYTSPSTPSGTGEVTFQVGTDYGAGTGIQYVDIVLSWSGGKDNGPYNDGSMTPKSINDIPMADRAATNSDLDVQWSEDGSTVAGTGLTYTWNQGHVGEDKTVYYRSRIIGASSYTSWHTLTFTDSRPEI